MELSLYAVCDRANNGALKRLAFGGVPGAFCRDNVNLDLLSKDNPTGLPFADLLYVRIGLFDTETFELKSIPREEIDIKKAYRFQFETPAEKIDGEKVE